ncbi:BspA family leucine-rich repeat surface protein [Maribellus luteus]|nr:BspA family leucine-rich repeat surface protein [Maribellus luteus]
MKAIISFLFCFVFIQLTYSQNNKISINDEAGLQSILKSSGIGVNFKISVKNARPFFLNPVVRKNENVIVGDTLQLDLFQNKNYLSVIKSITTDINGTTTIVSRLLDYNLAYCLISMNNDHVLMSVEIPELAEKYKTFMHTETALQYLVQLDETKVDILPGGHINSKSQEEEKHKMPHGYSGQLKNQTKPYPIEKSGIIDSSQQDSAEIDILVLYTPAAKKWTVDNGKDINLIISQIFASSNLASENSKLGIYFNNVYSTEVDYTESGSSETDLYNLEDGQISEVYALKDVTNADLVIVLTKTNDYGGLAMGLSNRNGDNTQAFAIVRVQQADDFITGIHEIGHLLGAGHHKKDQKDFPGPTWWNNTWFENTWSAGWNWTSETGNYCSIMTYWDGLYSTTSKFYTNVLYFSDPNILHDGQATGDADDANNARTIREVKHHVAGYCKRNTDNLPIVYTKLNLMQQGDSITVHGKILKEGYSPIVKKGVVWSLDRKPNIEDSFNLESSDAEGFDCTLTRLKEGAYYYIRTYVCTKNDTVYGNELVYLNMGKKERDFVTRWRIPEGQTSLQFLLARTGKVDYHWETVPALNSGSGTFYEDLSAGGISMGGEEEEIEGSPTSIGMVKITGLPEGKTIRLYIDPENLTSFCNRLQRCPEDIKGPDRENLIDVEQWGTAKWTNMENAFWGCKNLNISATDVPDFRNVYKMGWMFSNCTALNGPSNINDWYVGSVRDMWALFYCAELFNQNIGNWDVSNVNSMMGMFECAKSFNQCIGDWDVSKVKIMNDMFSQAKLFNQHIGSWNVSSVTTMSSMFSLAENFNRDISRWDVSSVTNISSMFFGAGSFNQNIGDWDVSNVDGMGWVFYDADSFNQFIGDWDVSKVISMQGMFFDADSFNQNIGDWDVSKVEHMDDMFYGTRAFNQNLEKWDLSSVSNVQNMLVDCGMDCANYSNTLKGWSENPNTPDSLILGAQNRQYHSGASDFRTELISTRGWTIIGDSELDEVNAAGEIKGELNVCSGQKGISYSLPKISNASSYLWSLPEGVCGNSTSNSITVDFDSCAVSGDIKVKGVNECGEGIESVISVNVNPRPETPLVTIVGDTLYSSSENGNVWYCNNEMMEAESGKKCIPQKSGNYYVVVQSASCDSKPSNVVTYVRTGSRNTFLDEKINVFPNPVRDKLIIEAHNITEVIDFEIISSSGKKILKSKLFDSSTIIETSNFPSGIFIIIFENSSGVSQKKIIKW